MSGHFVSIEHEGWPEAYQCFSERVAQLQGAGLAERLLVFVSSAADAGLDEAALVARTGVVPARIRGELRALARDGQVRILSEIPLTVAASAVVETAAERVVRVLELFHEREPVLTGIGREDLKARALPHASPVFYKALLDHLVAARRIGIEQEVIFQHGRKVNLAGAEGKLRSDLTARFAELGLQAPAPDDVAASLGAERATVRKVVQLLVKEGVLTRVSESLVVDRAAIDRLVETVRARKATKPTLAIGDFKDLTGLSRKFAVPLLEYLDSQRITRRVGDERVIL